MPDIQSGRLQASYSAHKLPRLLWPALPLPNYHQQDWHSCGFVAALTVVHYFDSKVSDVKVLEAVRPSINTGTDNGKMMKGLAALRIRADYREDLDTDRLFGVLAMGLPCIISVWPDDWDGDHWVVVRAMGADRVHLTNYGAVSLSRFEREWIKNWDSGDYGAGIICTRR